MLASTFAVGVRLEDIDLLLAMIAVTGALLAVEFVAAVVAIRWWRGAWSAPNVPGKVTLAMAGLVGALGLAGTVAGVAKAFGALGSDAEVELEARRLAEGISEAMNAFALAQLAWLPTAVVVFAMWWSRWRRRPRGSGR